MPIAGWPTHPPSAICWYIGNVSTPADRQTPSDAIHAVADNQTHPKENVGASTPPRAASRRRVVRGVVGVLLISTVSLLLNAYPALRILGGSGLLTSQQALVVGVLGALSMVVLLISGHAAKRELRGAIGDIWLGVAFQLLVWTLIGELLRLALTVADVPNRGAITAVAIVVAASIALGWGMWRALGEVPVTRTEITLPRLHPDLDGLTVAQITDTHLSRLLGPRWIARVVEQANLLDADIYCHTGDLADGSTHFRDPAVEYLGRVRGPHRYYITGNHEYFTDAEYWGQRMIDLGWQFLHNRHVVFERGAGRLVIAGIDDPTGTSSGLAGHGPDIERALAGTPDDAAILLLAHQPKQAKQSAAAGVDLQLAGHTHGGQMWPFHYLVRLEQKYVAGLYRITPRTQLYVSRGTGFWGPPFRIGARPEIALITLRSGASNAA